VGSRFWRNKATQPPPTFGEKGTKWVRYTGALPFEHRGSVTSTLYVWTERRPRLLVDARELPEIVEAAGRDNLEGLPEPRPEPKAREVETEEEEHDGDNDADGPDA